MDKHSIEKAYIANRDRLLRIAMAITGSHSDAEDIVQAVFADMLERNSFPDSPDRFLTVAVRNRAVNLWRHMNLRDKVCRALPLEESDIPDDIDRMTMEVESIVDRQLSPAVRRVVRSVFYSGRTYSGAATELNISVSTVNKHIVKALRILREQLNTNDHE